jgi:hypothetical protein
MNTSDPLAQLRDIHLPEPVSWWPPALGWWLVALTAMVLLIVGGWFYVKYILRKRYRKAALAELRLLQEKRQSHTNREQLAQLASLLRRVAIQTCGRHQVAPLAGDRWLRFLDESGHTDQFSNGVGRLLGEDHYRAETKMIPQELFQLAGKWIGGHRKC